MNKTHTMYGKPPGELMGEKEYDNKKAISIPKAIGGTSKAWVGDLAEDIDSEDKEDSTVEKSILDLLKTEKAISVPAMTTSSPGGITQSVGKDDEEDFGKPLPEKRKGESEFQQRIRHHTEHKEKHPGGRKQAIAIAAEQSGVARDKKKSLTLEACDILKDMSSTDALMGKKCPDHIEKCPSECLSYKGTEKASIEAMDGTEKIKKALTSRSFHIPRPYGGYDPYNVLRSATTVTNRQYSGLTNPSQGFSPDAQNTLEDVTEAEKKRTQQLTYKSCPTHGITYRIDNFCAPCEINKSSTCQSCGTIMNKSYGGTLFCPRCS